MSLPFFLEPSHPLRPGNAKVAGLEKDLGMQGTDLNKALTIFYVFVCLPSRLQNLHRLTVPSVVCPR